VADLPDRADPDSVANHGIDDVTDHYASVIRGLPAKPILIGHSFGGMIAEKLLGMDPGAAAIGTDAAQIKGVLQLPLSSLRATLRVFANPANRHKAVSLTAKEFPDRPRTRCPVPSSRARSAMAAT
jgi:pimeloyl-ACP methyl ester carboxylesterase